MRDRQSGLEKCNSAIFCLQKAHFKCINIGRLKVKGWTKKQQANADKRRDEWIYDEVDYKLKTSKKME